MCLVALAWRVHPRLPLVLVGNRDEYHARPTAAADWWHDAPDIIGGRDLAAGGSWLAVARSGRLATVTNFPFRPAPATDAPSRGHLVGDFVRNGASSSDYLGALVPRTHDYAGFCLLTATTDSAWRLRADRLPADAEPLAPGIHVFTNSSLDDPWPKATWLGTTLEQLLTREQEPRIATLLDLLTHHGPVGPAPGSGAAPGPAVAAQPFVSGAAYGTRSTTAVLVDSQGLCRFSERRFGPSALLAGESHFEFEIEAR